MGTCHNKGELSCQMNLEGVRVEGLAILTGFEGTDINTEDGGLLKNLPFPNLTNNCPSYRVPSHLGGALRIPSAIAKRLNSSAPTVLQLRNQCLWMTVRLLRTLWPCKALWTHTQFRK
ncbi:Uncharacterised protein r2_g3454 [Pycnogonum litorale]